MIVVTARIPAGADTIRALTPAIATMEQASRAEAGCVDYTFSTELSDPNALRIVERWETLEALQAHFTMPHMAEFQLAMAQHELTGVEVSFFDATEIPYPA